MTLYELSMNPWTKKSGVAWATPYNTHFLLPLLTSLALAAR